MKFADNEPFSGLAFKVANDPFVGSLTFVKNLFWNIKIWYICLQFFKRKIRESWKNAINAC